MSRGTITKLTNATVAFGANVTEPTLDLLVAMGHDNGPGVTEEFVTVPGLPYTVNVANFAGATYEAKVTAAVAYATANGKTSCLVNQPYDANLVSFNPAIHMVREGGNPTLDEWDVEAYGASETGDSYTAITQTLAGAAASGARRVIRLSRTYNVSKPVIPPISDFVFRGPGTGNFAATSGAFLRGTMAGGPVVLTSGPTSVLGLVSSLITGSGNAFTAAAGTSTHWFNLSLLDTCELNGLSQLCVETYFNVPAGAVSRNIIASNGQLLNTGLAGFFSQCLYFQVDSSGRLQVGLQTTGGAPLVNSGATTVNDGATHHGAMAWDGITLRLFVDGVLVGSSALGGTVQQAFFEQFVIGPMIGRVPEVTVVVSSGVTVDGVRVRNLATYTSNFTPSFAKWGAADNNTLAQCNFDDSVGAAIKVTNKNGTAWIPQTISTGGAGAGMIGFEGVSLSSAVDGRCSGLYLYGQSYHWHMSESSIRGCRNGIYAPGSGNHYTWKLDHLYIQSSAHMKYGVAFNQGGGLGVWNGGWIEGAQCGFVFAGAGLTVNNLFVQVAPGNGVHGGLVRAESSDGAPPVFNTMAINMEAGVSADWNGTLVLGGGLPQSAVVANGCTLEAHTKPWIIADALEGSQFNSCCFARVSGSPASIMTNAGLGGMVRAVEFHNCTQTPTWLPWSDVAGSAIVTGLGKVGAVTYSATPTFACDARNGFELSATLSGDITPTFTRMTPKQEITLLVKQDGSGGHAVNFGAEVKLASAVDTVANHYSLWTFEVALDGKLYQKSFASGA